MPGDDVAADRQHDDVIVHGTLDSKRHVVNLYWTEGNVRAIAKQLNRLW